MLKKLEEMRKQPKAVRDRYAFYGAVLVTSVIAGIWMLSIPAKFSAITNTEPVVTTNDESGSFSRALSDVRDQFGNVIDSFRDISNVSEEATSSNRIDIDGMFASTTTNAPAVPEAAPERVIRIATTSSAIRATTSPANP